ncbi:MAG: TraR/DksA family transcriptional regulator [Betaproteobacteria bacterium]|nr:TraR/DksA family transcriptional regulator [Betaproteobacteria bacterium]
MNNADIEQIKQKLIELRVVLKAQVESAKEMGNPVELDQARVGRLSRMDAMQSQQMALEAVRRCQEQLQKITGALQRIESDEYGCCFVCGEEIPIRRLLIDPTSTRCVHCA